MLVARPREAQQSKPAGSVHGDSIGVHACDSANAWRNMAKASNPRNTVACLILGAYQVAYDRVNRGGDFLHWSARPLAADLEPIKEGRPDALLRELDAAIRANEQARACAVVHRLGSLDQSPGPVFDRLLSYAVTEDGALHAEKYYRTVAEEFAATRPAFRWRQLVALARVTASEYGRPAPGIAEARERAAKPPKRPTPWRHSKIIGDARAAAGRVIPGFASYRFFPGSSGSFWRSGCCGTSPTPSSPTSRRSCCGSASTTPPRCPACISKVPLVDQVIKVSVEEHGLRLPFGRGVRVVRAGRSRAQRPQGRRDLDAHRRPEHGVRRVDGAVEGHRAVAVPVPLSAPTSGTSGLPQS